MDKIIKYFKVSPDYSKTEVAKIKFNIEPNPKKVYVYLIALGAGEYWGPNKNFDYFPEEELKKSYKTFEKAKVYIRHQHSDDKVIGKVIKAIWNDAMKRVELLVEIDRDKAPDIAKKIDKGETVDFSMGCSIAFDECSICSNRSYTRQDYCEHIDFHLGEILPDGRQVYMINYGCNFFDISVVKNRADITAISLKKVAKYGSDSSSEFLDKGAKNLLSITDRLPNIFIRRLLRLKPAKRRAVIIYLGILVRPEDSDIFEDGTIERLTPEEIEPFLEFCPDYSAYRPFLIFKIIKRFKKMNDKIDEDWPTINDKVVDYYWENGSKIFPKMIKYTKFSQLKPLLAGALLTPLAIFGYSAYRRQKLMAGAMPTRLDYALAQLSPEATFGLGALAGGVGAFGLAKLFKKLKKGEAYEVINSLPYTLDAFLIKEMVNTCNKNTFLWYNNNKF